MLRRRLLLLSVLTIALPLASCLEADLGEVPLLCNPGQPRCPRGYSCVAHDGAELCVKAGASLPSTSTKDASAAESRKPGSDLHLD